MPLGQQLALISFDGQWTTCTNARLANKKEIVNYNVLLYWHYNLITTKFQIYFFLLELFKIVKNYLKGQKQNIKINEEFRSCTNITFALLEGSFLVHLFVWYVPCWYIFFSWKSINCRKKQFAIFSYERPKRSH